MSEDFFKIVDQRNTGPNGEILDPQLRRRMRHPWCVECQEQYKKKYPGAPFAIECDGIYDQADFEQVVEETGLSIEEVRSCLDTGFWAEKHVTITDDEGNLVPFVAREYQSKSLRCTAKKIVDRWDRGNGKSVCREIKELHLALTKKNYPVLIVCPAKHQAQKWFDDLLKIDSRYDARVELKEAV